MNLWPPFLGAGIHVRSISADWSEAVVELRAQAAGGDKVLPEFEVEIHDREGTRVAAVHKTLYVRLKPRYRPT